MDGKGEYCRCDSHLEYLLHIFCAGHPILQLYGQCSTRRVDAPVTNATGQRIAGPSSYVADLFFSTNTTAQPDALQAAGFNTPFSSSYPGYFFGRGKNMGPFGVGSQLVVCQVRVWDTSYGTTYQSARDQGAEFGFSSLKF